MRNSRKQTFSPTFLPESSNIPSDRNSLIVSVTIDAFLLLIDLNKEFHLGNKFTLDVATKFSEMLDDSYRVIVKYDGQNVPTFKDDKFKLDPGHLNYPS